VKYTNELIRCYRFTCNDVFTISHDNDCSGRTMYLFTVYEAIAARNAWIYYVYASVRQCINRSVRALPWTTSVTNPLVRNCYQVWQTKFIIIINIIQHR